MSHLSLGCSFSGHDIIFQAEYRGGPECYNAGAKEYPGGLATMKRRIHHALPG